MSSLRRGHANLLCIVPILADDLFRGSGRIAPQAFPSPRNAGPFAYGLWTRNAYAIFKKKKERNKRKSWGRAGIEPATSPTRTENHTSRPTARVPVKVASSEDRTRDLALTRRMLCQLSYRGEDEARPSLNRANWVEPREAKKVCIDAIAAAWASGRLTLH